MPVLLSEIRKLCEISDRARVADLELIGHSPWIAVSVRRSANPVPTAPFAEHLTLTARVHDVREPFRLHDRLRRPDFEFLRPSVVIRRRPQRN